MSIPPLVCSTPPPPEQCEDDKDPDEFDLNYNNLSQEDDSADYDYGNFSSFNHFQSSTSESCQELNNKTPSVNNLDIKCVKAVEINHAHVTKEKIQVETSEDDVIEDLDLKIDHEPVVDSSKTNKDSEVNISEHSVKDLNTDIPLKSAITQDELDLSRSSLETNLVNGDEKTETAVNEIIDQKSDNIKSVVCHKDITIETADIPILSKFESVVEENVTDSIPHKTENDIVQEGNINCNNLDDFEDFDDFQFISSDNKPEIIFHTNVSPWENKVSQNIGFGEFTANFALNADSSLPASSEDPIQRDNNDSEDDFGDFDEFKSVNETKHTLSPDRTVCEDIPVLNLQSSESEHQIIERINEVMHSIFQQRVVESDSIIENRLEGSLGETWGYLLETDIRQPYIVNWNNSLAQKTLLKALCIDSRNILFGPKWSYNMPKYAANLSTAPLQPQKQPGQSNIPQSETANLNKAANKTSWTDPFTSDGQEFTYAEALLLDLEHLMATLDQMAHNHSTLKISELLSHACSTENGSVMETGPTDLDVFEANVSTKSDKTYSNTLSIQPIRQINLPDTHIFTPTDSETPRSKTIHYDNRSAHAGLVSKSDNISLQTHSLENDNDYWEFQDFRGNIQSKDLPSTVNEEPKGKVDTGTSKELTPTSKYNIETQVLQPVKLELVMPTLNWPNPGEVKETFDDFTDFMSNSPSHNENVETVTKQSSNIPTKLVSEILKVADESKHKNIPTLGTSEKLDDDFEMFQSAIPPFKKTSQPGFSNMGGGLVHDNTSATLRATSNLTDFEVVFAATDKDKNSENISVSHRAIENAIKKEDNLSNVNELIFNASTIQPNTLPITNVLQPTIAIPDGVKPNQQKMGQILQPLSLESYSQINWPNPGINLQDLSRFNPVETLQSLKNETSSQSKTASPVHSHKGLNTNQTSDDDIWGEFVSSKPKQQTLPKKATTFTDDDEWTDFVSSPSVNPQNGLNTISFNVHTNSGLQKSNTSKYQPKVNEIPLDIPTLNYITPKTTSQTSYNERHFQNL